MKEYTIKIFIGLSLTLIFGGCATNRLSQSVWQHTAILEKDGKQSLVATGLYFTASDTVYIYCAVTVDTVVVVKPFQYAEGVYSITGKRGKKASVFVRAETIRGDKIEYKGGYPQKNVLELYSKDSIYTKYVPLKPVKENGGRKHKVS